MPWVRIDENALDHPKIHLLPDGAFRLWVQGLAFCQKFLTDGFISSAALRTLKGYAPKRKDQLVTAGLWDRAEGGIAVHDYLQWNDSKERVLERRSMGRDRLQRHINKRESKRETERVSNAHTNADPAVGGVGVVDLPERGAGENREPRLADTPSTVAERAGTFCNETYPQLYVKHRKGARYVSQPALDFPQAVLLCQTWDDDRLAKIATVFLTTDNEFAERGSRSIGQLRALASWCDGRLREAGL